MSFRELAPQHNPILMKAFVEIRQTVSYTEYGRAMNDPKVAKLELIEIRINYYYYCHLRPPVNQLFSILSM